MNIDNTKYIECVVDFLHTTSKEISTSEILKLINRLYTDIDIKNVENNIINDFDLDSFNRYIKNNESNHFLDLLNDIYDRLFCVDKEYIREKWDNFLTYIVNNIQEEKDQENLSRTSLLESVTSYEKIALIVSSFNYNMEYSGLQRWYDNGYIDELEDFKEFLNKSNFKDKNILLNMLDCVELVDNAILDLDSSNFWYDEDVKTRYDYLNGFEREYDRIKDDWKNYFEDYLIDNLPYKYIKKINEIKEMDNISINI